MNHQTAVPATQNSCPILPQIHISRCKTGKCIICGRKLTAPKSVERSVGDVCFSRYFKGFRGIQSRIEDFGIEYGWDE